MYITDELATIRSKRLNMASMKLLLQCLTFALLCCTFVGALTWRVDRVRLCFVRPENNGAMNVLESWIRVAYYNVPVIVGQAVCMRSPATVN